MSLIVETETSWWQRFMCNVLKAGPIPHHVAFILDGNRRYARKMGWKEAFKGHQAGFDKLAKVSKYSGHFENFCRY